MKIPSLLLLAAFLCTATLHAQKGQHTIHAELGGRAFIWGSVNYEYHLANRLSLGAGLGLANAQRGDITREVNGATETGKYFDLYNSSTLYANYFAGSDRHQLVLSAGLTNYQEYHRNVYPSGRESGLDMQVKPHLGMGYQYNGRDVFARLMGYYMGMPEPSGWFPSSMPWIGISVGRHW